MSRFRIGAMITICVLVGLCSPSVSRAEDGIYPLNIYCGANCGDLTAKTRPDSLVSAIPGGTFVITVAHVAPSPEDAMVNGMPASCDPAKFRIDTLTLKTEDGSIEVELGEQQSLAPGETYRMMYNVSPNSGSGRATYELDQMAFRFRSGASSSRCSVIANGQFYATPTTTTPTAVALIPSAGPAPGANQRVGR
jgi:hypothetical protein